MSFEHHHQNQDRILRLVETSNKNNNNTKQKSQPTKPATMITKTSKKSSNYQGGNVEADAVDVDGRETRRIRKSGDDTDAHAASVVAIADSSISKSSGRTTRQKSSLKSNKKKLDSETGVGPNSSSTSNSSFVVNEAHQTRSSSSQINKKSPTPIIDNSPGRPSIRLSIGSTSSPEVKPVAVDEQSVRLVFGLHSRTNKLRHNEYAAERRSQLNETTSNNNNPKIIDKTIIDKDNANLSDRSDIPSASSLKSESESLDSQSTGNFERILQTKEASKIKNKKNSSQSSSKTLRESSIETRECDDHKQELIIDQKNRPRRDIDQDSTTKTTARDTMVSQAKKQSSTNVVNQNNNSDKASNSSNSTASSNNIDQQKQDVDQASKTTPVKMQFNIPPPPPSKLTANKSSLVSYAKARIYDKQPPVLSTSILPPGTTLTTSSSGYQPAATTTTSLSSSKTLNNLSRSIVAGFKPPKQVDVSKAREKWEGGEPFAKCKSRQRLAATQAGKKLQLYGSWSMTSVVATQQMQLQQALAQSAARGQKPGFGDDTPVKILSRGSVLERVQKFESAPSVSELAEASIGVAPPETLALSSDAHLLANATAKETCFVESPVAGLTTDQYLSTLNNDIKKTLEELRLNANASASSGGSPLPSPLAYDIPRRLSFRRRSSASSIQSLAAKIPKFYHPNGKPNTYEIELQRRNIVACFDKFPDRKASLLGPNCKRHFHQIAQACGFSEYFKEPLLLYARHLEPTWSQERVPHYLGRKQSSFDRLPNTIGARKLSTGQNNANATIKTGTTKTTNTRPNLTRSSSIDVTRSAENKENNPSNITDSNESLIPKFITCDQYFVCWRHIIEHAYDNSARFIHLLTFGQRNYLLPDDFIPLIQSIIDDHPGLRFLGNAPDFHMRYIQTVIARIYFNINKSWTGKISQSELRHSNLIDVLQRLSQTDDINEITDYFSYEHFYVIYCKFWSLDQDHDLEISKEDLIRHNDASISSRIIERIFMGIVSKHIQERGKMGYSDFVWFLIAEEDKKHPRSIEYWFRLMDIDGDGYISMYEMEYFYLEQMKRLELMSIEPLPFVDCACQMLDLVNPKEKNRISLSDLKRTKMVTIFFDTFINLEKYLEHESREFVSTRDVIINGKIVSDWDRFASQEYESLISEETTV